MKSSQNADINSMEIEKTQLLYECCKELKYRFYKEGEAVCNYGDIGEEFYIIIEGTVGIQTPKTIEVLLP